MFFFEKDGMQIIDEIHAQNNTTNTFDQSIVIKNDMVLKENTSATFNNGGVIIGSLSICDSGSIKIEKNPLIVKSNVYIDSDNSICGDLICLGKTTIKTAKEITGLKSVELDSQVKNNDISADLLTLQETIEFARIADEVMEFIGGKGRPYSKMDSPWCKKCKRYKGTQQTCPHCNE